MTSRQQARAIFAKMPDEVFRLYIEPLISDLGWEYTSKNAIVSQGWQLAFDNNQLSTIVELSWRKGSTDFLSMRFHPNSTDNLYWIMKAHLDGVRTPCSDVRDGKRRFEGWLSHIEHVGSLPIPVVLMDSLSGYRILDGNHRLAAALALSRKINTHVPYWLGSRSFSVLAGFQWC